MKKENRTESRHRLRESRRTGGGKKGFVTMFMIMLGFTFFSASMWAGQQLAAGLDFWGFLKSLLFGGAILGLYTGLLGYVGAKTGMSMDLLAQKASERKVPIFPLQ